MEMEFDLISFLLGSLVGVVCGAIISTVLIVTCFFCRRRKDEKTVTTEDNPYYRSSNYENGYAKDINSYY